MKILLTNDDGVRAVGLWAAANALRHVGEVFVVAPDKEQSGVGASLTLRSGLRVTPEPVDSRLVGDSNGFYPVTAYAVEEREPDALDLDPKPLRATNVENALVGQELTLDSITAASERISQDLGSNVFGDSVFASADFRRTVVGVEVKHAIFHAMGLAHHAN